VVISADGASSPGGEPADLARWGLHCYCPTARSTPHSVVAEGSNGRLLYEARGGTSRQTLQARGIPVTDEQVAQLIEYSLLDMDGDVLRTACPVLGGAATSALRQQLQPLGSLLAGQIATPIAALRAELEGIDLAGSTYAVAFGYALDGSLWNRLALRGAVPDTTLCDARPWWNGAFWAVYPPRESAAGTNLVGCGDAQLVQVWTTTTTARLDALARAAGLTDTVRALLDPAGAEHSGKVVDVTGVTWPLRRPDGRPAIPVVGVNGPLDRIASRIADIVAEALIGTDMATVRAMVPCDDAKTAAVVVAHELIWDITEALVASGAVDLPPSLRNAHTTDEIPVDLLFIKANDAAST
jgi:hypothetical protein